MALIMFYVSHLSSSARYYCRGDSFVYVYQIFIGFIKALDSWVTRILSDFGQLEKWFIRWETKSLVSLRFENI